MNQLLIYGVTQMSLGKTVSERNQSKKAKSYMITSRRVLSRQVPSRRRQISGCQQVEGIAGDCVWRLEFPVIMCRFWSWMVLRDA